jgi:hypothetical protein
VERKILLFAKLMSICFAGIGLFSLIDTWLTPESQIQYVLAHESEMGYRSSSKYGANHYRDNYLHCIPFRSRMPYHLRTTGEIDTLLIYADVAVRFAEAQQMQQEPLVVSKIPVDQQTYYDLEDGDSIRLFFSPLRNKPRGYTQYRWPFWLTLSEKQLKKDMPCLNPVLSQWVLTTQVFAFLAMLLCLITWWVKPFHISVGVFVFNCVITSLLYWLY